MSGWGKRWLVPCLSPCSYSQAWLSAGLLVVVKWRILSRSEQSMELPWDNSDSQRTEKLLVALGNVIFVPLVDYLWSNTPRNNLLCTNTANDPDYSNHFLLMAWNHFFCLLKKNLQIGVSSELPNDDKVGGHSLNSEKIVFLLLVWGTSCASVMLFAQWEGMHWGSRIHIHRLEKMP